MNLKDPRLSEIWREKIEKKRYSEWESKGKDDCFETWLQKPCIIFLLIRALTDCREGLRKYANSKDKRDIVENNIYIYE